MKSQSKYLTRESLDEAILGQDISFGINQFGILIEEDVNKESSSLWVDQIQFNTSAKNYIESQKNKQRANKPWKVFSIDNIDMQVGSSSRGNISKTKLIYDKSQEKLSFLIKSIEYQNLKKPEQPLLKSRESQKYFFEATFQFQRSLLDRVKLTVSPISFNIPTNVLAKELGAGSLAQNLSLQRRARLSQLLVSEVFRPHIFKEVEQSLNQEKLKRQAHPQRKESSVSHISVFAATPDHEVNAKVENLHVNCLVEDTVRLGLGCDFNSQ